MKIFGKNVSGLKARLYRPFKPKSVSIRQVAYKGAIFAVFANEAVGWRLLVRKDYEGEEIDMLGQMIRAEDVCLDVGGNIGIFSVFMARKANAGKVIVFEPIPVNRSIISLNCALNGVTNIEMHDEALSDTCGETTFSVSRDSSYSSLKATNRDGEAYLLEVKMRTLDDVFVRSGQRIDVVKMDVEGAELLVLKGGAKLLSVGPLRPRFLLIEFSSKNSVRYGYHPDEIVALMSSYGYDVYSLRKMKLIKGWKDNGRSENVLFLNRDEVKAGAFRQWIMQGE